ncbi:MAG: phosphodiester glycosidase family protein [Mycobacterium sp.]|nr:phosphodiester glycosidase family protein [Mycobacterium sp.]
MRIGRAAVAFMFAVSSAIAPGVAWGAPTASGAGWLPPTPTYWPLVAGQDSTPSAEITSGITYQQTSFQTVGGPQRGSVLDVNAANPNVAFNPVLSSDHLASAGEAVSAMAGRTGAVAGVNGDYFNGVGRFPLPLGQGQPTHLLMQGGQVVNGGLPDDCGVLGYTADHHFTIGRESFSGTVSAGTVSAPLSAVNALVSPGPSSQCNTPTAPLGLVLVTPLWSDQAAPMDAAAPVAELADLGGSQYRVTSVSVSQSSLPAQQPGQAALVGEGNSASFVTALQPGQDISVSDGVTPDPGLVSAVGGGFLLLTDGQLNPELGAGPVPPGAPDPVQEGATVVGISQDGTRAVIGVFDGQQPGLAGGVGYHEMAGWLQQQGMYQGLFYDSGGSSDMVARLPGQTTPTVRNTPSDGHERLVAECLCFSSTETTPGPATTAVVNDGKQLGVLTGTTEPLSTYATDAAGNPASDPVSVSVEPAGLATVSGSGADMKLTAGPKPGRGWLAIQAGNAKSREPLSVAPAPASLSLSPAQPDLNNGGTQQFTLTGTAVGSPSGNFEGGGPLSVGARNATWTVSPSDLGTITADGLFTAAASGGGLATITATAGGLSATASVAVGSDTELVDPMTDVSAFSIIDKFMDVFPRNVPSPGATSISDGSISASTVSRLPTESGSIDLHYDFKPAQTVYHTNLYPNDLGHDVIGPNAAGQSPTAYSFWIKTVPAFPGALSPPAAFYVTSGYYDSSNAPLDFNIPPVVTDGWQQINVPLPATTRFPIELNYINMVNIDPTREYTGDMYIADLQADYSPRPPATQPYVPIPKNPSWLQYVNSPADFGSGGATIADFDDSHLVADDPNSTGTVVTQKIISDIKALPANAAPNLLQVNGDLTDTGSTADLQYGYQTLQSFGLPFHDAPGNHEASQGADPQNGNWSKLFGPTHYSYTDGDANFIVTDSASGGLLASDKFQVPVEEQYTWLASQLDANTSKVVFLITHMPPYDPHPVNNSHFSDPYEAQQYMQLAANYQATHPQVHVVLLNGHARGVAEQILNPQGQADPNGLPNFTIADAGVSAAAYTPIDQGGFYNYALFHILPNGDVQFAIQPVLSSIDVTAPQAGLAVGASEQLTATGTTPTGDDLDPIQVPITDPASHQWTSSNQQVASIDPSTGTLTAIKPGTATISIESGGITASTTITVTD